MENKNNLTLAEQKELVDYAFERSKKHMWYIFTRVMPAVFLVVAAVTIVVVGVVLYLTY